MALEGTDVQEEYIASIIKMNRINEGRFLQEPHDATSQKTEFNRECVQRLQKSNYASRIMIHPGTICRGFTVHCTSVGNMEMTYTVTPYLHVHTLYVLITWLFLFI
jgi:hypothetical protein